MLLSRKQKTFSQFFSSFLKSSFNLEHFQKKMTLIADVFPKLRTPKNMVRTMPKSPVSEDPTKSNMVNAPKHCSNLREHSFTIFINHWEVTF